MSQDLICRSVSILPIILKTFEKHQEQAESVYLKCHFMFLIKNSKFYTKILFLPQYEKWNSKNGILFSYLKDFYFGFLMLSFVFHLHKKLENVMQFAFCFSFSRINWKKNYLKRSRLNSWLFSQVWSTRYLKASLCQFPWYFPLHNGHVDAKNMLLRK